MRRPEYVTHEFGPLFDGNSRILMLGSIPSPKSREQGFYYGHPRNRFWPVLAKVLGERVPETVEEKRALAIGHGVALWDVLAGCEIRGADDGSIRNPTVNEIGRILEVAPVRAVFTTGGKAAQLYRRYCYPDTGVEAFCLPSTSPANCRMSEAELEKAYRVILRYL